MSKTKKKPAKAKKKSNKTKETPKLPMPKELHDLMLKDYEVHGDEDPPNQVPVRCGKEFVLDNRYFVLADNTSGSDDYHEAYYVGCVNAEKVFGCQWREFIAKAAIFKKINPDQPAYFLIRNVQCWNGAPEAFYALLWE